MATRSRIHDQWLLEGALVAVSGAAAVSSGVIGLRALIEPRLTVEAVRLTEPSAADPRSTGRFRVEPPPRPC